MGRHQYNLKSPIKSQIIIAVISIAICSLFATLVTYVTIGVLLHRSNSTEEAASELEGYVSRQGTTVLNPTEQSKLKSVADGEVEYLVVNAKAHPIYGTLHGTRTLTKADLFRKLNVASVQRQGFVIDSTVEKVIPVLDKNGSFVGAVYLAWHIFPGGSRDPNVLTRLMPLALLLSPFFYILLFTYIFARNIGKKLNRPLQALIEATRRLRQRDLDFSIDYHGTNEIGKVLDAFEDMRKDLKESLKAQWALEDERREMLAAIAHDVRTPITIIQGHAEVLLENPSQSPERLERYLQAIARNTRRVARLMDDFRTVTDIDSPEFSLHPIQTDAAEYIHAKYNEFVVMMRDHGIRFALDCKDTRRNQGTVFLDTDRISQVVDNLMANAIRFTPAGGKVCWHVLIEEKRLQVAIEDTGQGLPKGESTQVFHKFYQGDQSRSGEHGHSGLGLYIVKALVEKHGGAVSVQNNPRGGASFRFHVTALDTEL